MKKTHTANDEMVVAINSLTSKSLADAKALAKDILNKMSFKKGSTSKTRLENDVNRAPTSAEVCRIMYYTLLSGEGMSIPGSTWNK